MLLGVGIYWGGVDKMVKKILYYITKLGLGVRALVWLAGKNIF